MPKDNCPEAQDGPQAQDISCQAQGQEMRRKGLPSYRRVQAIGALHVRQEAHGRRGQNCDAERQGQMPEAGQKGRAELQALLIKKNQRQFN